MADLSITDLRRRLQRLEEQTLPGDEPGPDTLTGTGLGVDLEDSGSEVLQSAVAINFAGAASVSDDGDGTGSVTVTDTRTDVSDGGTTVVSEVSDINFDSEVSVTDDGDGTVTVNPTMRSVNIPTTTLAGGGEYITTRIFVPEANTFELWSLGVQNDGNNSPPDLQAQVIDEDNSNTLYSLAGKRADAGSSPLATASDVGGLDIAMRIINNTGNSHNATAHFDYALR